jgi:lysophospholipase L1-like esterase
LSTEKYILVGDSLIKFINRTKHTRVQAFPGVRAQGLLNKVIRRELRVERYYIIIVAAGTNDASDLTMPPRLAALGLIMLMANIRGRNPNAIIAFSGMLIRPRDQGTAVEYRRRLINTIVQGMCKERGFLFFKNWTCLMTGSNVRQRVYARDNIHLNRFGARHLYRRIEGNIRSLEGRLN